MSQTTLDIVNGTSQPILVYFTLGAGAGNTTLADLSFVTPVQGNPLQGYFTLAANGSQTYTPPAGTTLIGNLSFGGPPINCPTGSFPNAVNLFEFALDLASGGQETVDISCVAGVNAELSVTLAGGGGWNAGNTQPSVTTFQNGAIGTNTGRVGVYPVSCDVCTASQAPPICNPPVQSETPQSEPICNVQRPASTSGGTVTVTYMGPL
jgi:hypothetical protein